MTQQISDSEETTNSKRININYLSLRRCLGILGIALPFVLIFGNACSIEKSISHYYYTNMSVVFTGTLIAFGLFLISYRGYVKESDELVSDNFVTNLAGVFAIIVALIPTACSACQIDAPNGHDDSIRNMIHLVSAALFIVLMGYMSFVQFVKSDKTDPLTLRRKKIYRICGLLIWAAVLFLLLEYVFKFKISVNDTFWGETVALFFFGIAWFVKSESLENFGI